MDYCNTNASQAAKDVRASEDALVDIFERIEMFFRRLEIYTEVQATTDMMNIIIQIMVQVLSILGIATKEVKQSRMSEYLLHKYVALIERYLEKYAKKLIGRTDMEDALKRLDKLTQEEAWMGIAQNLKSTYTLGESVRGVVDKVATIDDRVAGVGDRVDVVDNAVQGVHAMVASIDDRVKVVDDRVAEVVRGA